MTISESTAAFDPGRAGGLGCDAVTLPAAARAAGAAAGGTAPRPGAGGSRFAGSRLPSDFCQGQWQSKYRDCRRTVPSESESVAPPMLPSRY